MTRPQLLDSVNIQQASKMLVWAIFVFGVIARVAQYLANRSLWLGEAMLSLNIVNRSFASLLQPLDYDQAAPIGFLMLEKWATQIFGVNEYALRLFPLCSGVAAMWLFYSLARRLIEPIAVPIALGLFATLDPMIYYSSEVKQYSSDMFITLLLLWLGLAAERKGWTVLWILLLALVGGVAVWFSHVAVFVLAGIGAVFIFFRASRKEPYIVIELGLAFSFIGLSFASVYFVSLQAISNNQTLLAIWQHWFMPFPATSLLEARWFPETFFEIFDYPMGLGLPQLGAFGCIIGMAAMLGKDKRKFFLLIAPILFVLIASALRKYPFGDRLILFLVPILLIFIGEGVARLKADTSALTAVIQVGLIGLLLFQPIIYAAKHLVQPRTAEEIKPVLGYIQQRRESQDVTYVYYSAQYAFQFYARSYDLAHNFVVGIKSRETPENYARDLDKLRGQPRVWILLTHIYERQGASEQTIFLNDLDKIGARRDSFSSPGAVVYLYDLSGAK